MKTLGVVRRVWPAYRPDKTFKHAVVILRVKLGPREYERSYITFSPWIAALLEQRERQGEITLTYRDSTVPEFDGVITDVDQTSPEKEIAS